MTDPRLRQLARAGAPRAQLLVERMRAGELSRERVELAAHCGDHAAWIVLGDKSVVMQPDALPGWAAGLTRFGQEACVRAAVAAQRIVTRDDLERADWEVDYERVSGSLDQLEGDLLQHGALGYREAIEAAARLTSEQAVREAIRAEVVPWALGERDVVRERVEARRG